MTRFPFGMPDGWFPVAYSDELTAGDARTLQYFDRELVAFRGEDGVAAVVDSESRHANCFPVLERNGFVMAWHHGEARAPDFHVPAFGEWGAPDWTTTFVRRSWQVRTHPQEVLENAVDWAHFESVHGMPPPQDRHESYEGKTFRWMVGRSRTTRPIAATRDDCLVDAVHFGLGFGWLRYNGMYTTVAATGVTPIDRETVEIRLAVIGKRDGRSEAATREGLEAYIEGQAAAVDQDVPIWERKSYRPDSALAESDASIVALRRWARQFYSGGEVGGSAGRNERDG